MKLLSMLFIDVTDKGVKAPQGSSKAILQSVQFLQLLLTLPPQLCVIVVVVGWGSRAHWRFSCSGAPQGPIKKASAALVALRDLLPGWKIDLDSCLPLC
jgi:hypothetical protein